VSEPTAPRPVDLAELGFEKIVYENAYPAPAELDAKVDAVVDNLAAKLPQTTRYTKQQLDWWRDRSGHETIGHARDWLALSMAYDEAQGAVEAFLRR